MGYFYLQLGEGQSFQTTLELYCGPDAFSAGENNFYKTTFKMYDTDGNLAEGVEVITAGYNENKKKICSSTLRVISTKKLT